MKRVIKRKPSRKQSRKPSRKQTRKRNNKSLSKRKVKRRTGSRPRSKRQSKLRSKLRSKKFNSRIKSIFKRSLKKKQRGGNASKCNTPKGTSVISAKGRGGMTNTLDNINNAGGQFVTDSYLGAENSIGNLYNNFMGQPESLSPDPVIQPLSQ